MGSWKTEDVRGRTYAAGDLVELREMAEKGFEILYRVGVVHTDGALYLIRLTGVEDGVTVEAADIAEYVFPARLNVRAAQGF
ncbi:hypothetical protein [Mycolicibacterium aubagnense]|uniref:DUF1653 domain-containing protein n=1 Tax=Mycolicibacterium aubagnense TaxID=319707 RepID=A0ABM7IMH7_9MYCO|nr:hypothetical protein [Mycolicibacterium aubagnense]TLH48546.1 hypothetical protein C1S80_29980 [Mycolicibacterium aubagnense]BBX88016.1 hypothetical protein MAUB_58890 [Mycolicibacterium aubagnense]